jgi:hypothetical protein
VQVPTSAEELQGEVSSFSINTLEFGSFAVLADVDVESNPWVYSIVLAMAGANGLTLLVFAYRDRREQQQRRERLKRLALLVDQKLVAAAAGGRAIGAGLSFRSSGGGMSWKARAGLSLKARGGGTGNSRGPSKAVAASEQEAREAREAPDLASAIDGRLDQLDEWVAKRAHTAAMLIQKHVRGKRTRAAVGPVGSSAEQSGRGGSVRGTVAGARTSAGGAQPAAGARAAASGKPRRKHRLTRVIVSLADAVRGDHSMLGMWYGDAELCQCFWNTAMLGLVISCALYSAPQAASTAGVAQLTEG